MYIFLYSYIFELKLNETLTNEFSHCYLISKMKKRNKFHFLNTKGRKKKAAKAQVLVFVMNII